MSFFLLLLESITILLARVEWINDWLTIPVYEQVEAYRFIPEAKLYIDDYLIPDAEVVYERNGVEWTFISTVNTSKVKSYSIKYRATFVDYLVSSVHTIVFDVVDLEPPQIISIPEKEIAIGEGLPKFLEGIVFKDNYYQPEELSVHVDLSRIVQKQIGIYPVIYYVSDPSGNIKECVVQFKIIDPIPPSITQQKQIVLNINESLIWKDYLTIKDNVDLVIDVYLDDRSINYDQPGQYPITVYATDKSQNQSSVVFQVTIADLSEPVIVLKSSPPNITVNTEITRELLESYIISVQDNYSLVKVIDVLIMHDIESDTLGKYNIYFELKDEAGNKATNSLAVHVVDNIKPTITLIEPLVFDVYSTQPFFRDYFDYSDNYQQLDDLTYKLTESVKMHIVGYYPITFEVTDKSQNKAIYQGYVQIVDREPPVITQLNDIIITNFEAKDFSYYFEVFDQYDSPQAIGLTFDDNEVDYDQIGIYQCIAYATDLSFNRQEHIFEIVVIDMIEPTLTLSKQIYIHQIGDEELDLYTFIESFGDNYDNTLLHDIVIEGQVSWHVLGKYIITYSLEDHSKNRVTQELVITIDDFILPTLEVENLELSVGDLFNPFDGIIYDDNLGTPQILILPAMIDTNNVGTYIITYIVYDVRGNYITKDRTVTIYPKEQSLTVEPLIPVILVTLIGCGVLYILYKKR